MLCHNPSRFIAYALVAQQAAPGRGSPPLGAYFIMIGHAVYFALPKANKPWASQGMLEHTIAEKCVIMTASHN